jgi:hypothetical protein
MKWKWTLLNPLPSQKGRGSVGPQTEDPGCVGPVCGGPLTHDSESVNYLYWSFT